MYNRYIPTSDGCYRKTVVDAEPEAQTTSDAPAAPQCPECGQTAALADCRPKEPPELRGLRFPKLETGDWLVLLILLLLLTDGEGVDLPCLLVAAAVFLFF